MSDGDENISEKRTEASDGSETESDSNSSPTQRIDLIAVEFEPGQSDEAF